MTLTFKWGKKKAKKSKKPAKPQNTSDFILIDPEQKGTQPAIHKFKDKSKGAHSSPYNGFYYETKNETGRKYFIKKEDRPGPEFAEIWIGLFLNKLLNATALKQYKDNFALPRPGAIVSTEMVEKEEKKVSRDVILQDLSPASPLLKKRRGAHELLFKSEVIKIGEKFDSDQFAATVALSLLVADYGVHSDNFMGKENNKKPVRIDFGAGLRSIAGETEAPIFETLMPEGKSWRSDLKYLELWILTPPMKQALAEFFRKHSRIFADNDLLRKFAQEATEELFEFMYKNKPAKQLKEIYIFLMGESNMTKAQINGLPNEVDKLKKLISDQLSEAIVSRAERMLTQGLKLDKGQKQENWAKANVQPVPPKPRQKPEAQSLSKEQIRHNLDVLIGLEFFDEDENPDEKPNPLAELQIAKPGQIIPVGETNYLFANQELIAAAQYAKDLDELCTPQLILLRELVTSDSDLIEGYSKVIKAFEDEDLLTELEEYIGDLQAESEAKKWTLTDQLPDRMKAKLAGCTRVVSVVAGTDLENNNQCVSIYQSPGQVVFADNADLVAKLNAHPVSLKLGDETWYIFARLDSTGEEVEFLKSVTNSINNAQIITYKEVMAYSDKDGPDLTSDVIMKLGKALKNESGYKDVFFMDDQEREKLESVQRLQTMNFR